MRNPVIKKGGLAALALAFVTLVAWKAPEVRATATSIPAATATTTAPAAAGTASVVPVSSYAPIVENVMPAVVTIRVEKRAQPVSADQQQLPDELLRRFFGDQGGQMPQMRRMPRGIERGLGSGVIMTHDGYILTNNHVVDGVDSVKVDLPDDRTFSAKVVGTDPASDLAVVKIDAKDLPTLAFGDSDTVRVGDVVLAIGNPLNVGETVTSGIISAKGRTTPGSDGYQDFLQTDAPINHGNSGGALVNTAGQLIGINSQILSPSDGNIGLGFAIPSNMAKNVMNQLIKTGAVHRAKLGVTVQLITPDMATAMNLPSDHGALVSGVDAGSPAAHAGLQQGDVITKYNGKTVKDNNELRNEVAGTTPGSTVALEVLRAGHTKDLTATVGELDAKAVRSNERPESREGGKFGMSVEPLTPDTAAEAGVPRSTQGILVGDVDPSGIAADSGLQAGDVITKVDGHAVTSVDSLKSSLDRKDGRPSLVVVNRKGATLFLTLRAD